ADPDLMDVAGPLAGGELPRRHHPLGPEVRGLAAGEAVGPPEARGSPCAEVTVALAAREAANIQAVEQLDGLVSHLGIDAPGIEPDDDVDPAAVLVEVDLVAAAAALVGSESAPVQRDRFGAGGQPLRLPDGDLNDRAVGGEAIEHGV